VYPPTQGVAPLKLKFWLQTRAMQIVTAPTVAYFVTHSPAIRFDARVHHSSIPTQSTAYTWLGWEVLCFASLCFIPHSSPSFCHHRTPSTIIDSSGDIDPILSIATLDARGKQERSDVEWNQTSRWYVLAVHNDQLQMMLDASHLTVRFVFFFFFFFFFSPSWIEN